MGYCAGNAYDDEQKREWREHFASLPRRERWPYRFQSFAIAAFVLFIVATFLLDAFGILG